MATKLAQWLPTLSHVVLQDHMKKLKPIYVHCHNAHDYQTWQGGKIQGRASFKEVTRPFDQVVLQGHMKN